MKEKILNEISKNIDVPKLLNELVDNQLQLKLISPSEISNKTNIKETILKYITDNFTEDELLDLYNITKQEKFIKIFNKFNNSMKPDMIKIIKYWVDLMVKEIEL